MCGIFGLTFKEDIEIFSFIKQKLEAIVYRGYDSSGICALDHNGFHLTRAPGFLDKLALPALRAKVAMGHVRWATHGKPSVENTHPFTTEHIALAHNGIIENIQDLKGLFNTSKCVGETDSEVVAQIVQHFFIQEGSALLALEKTLALLKGQWGFALMCKTNPGALLFARQGSPVFLGKTPQGYCLTSDTSSLPQTTTHVAFLQDGDYGFITQDSAIIYHNKREVQRLFEEFTPQPCQASKEGFSSFFLKEIFQSPLVAKTILQNTLASENPLTFTSAFHEPTKIRSSRVQFVACGSSYYAAKMGCVWMRALSGIHANAYIGSEYSWQCAENSLVVFISQSGETADILRCLKTPPPTKTLALINRPDSALRRLVPRNLLLHAGAEKSVAATKSFLAQIMTLFCMALKWSSEPHTHLWESLLKLPENLTFVQESLQAFTDCVQPKDAHAFIFMGSEETYPIAVEGSLKMKELSYLPSFAKTFVNSPLLHMTRNTFLVVLLNTQEESAAHHSIASALTHQAPVVVISNGPASLPTECAHIATPLVPREVFPLLATPYVQILAHVVAKRLGRNIDQPRNLAKSVTVE